MIGTFVKALQQSLKMCWIFQTDTEWVYSHLTGRLKNCQLNQQWICCCAICFIIRAMWANVGQHLAIFYICGTWYHIFVQQSVFFSAQLVSLLNHKQEQYEHLYQTPFFAFVSRSIYFLPSLSVTPFIFECSIWSASVQDKITAQTEKGTR